MEKPSLLQATVFSITKLSSHVYQYVFDLPTPLQFTPGQYATFIIDAQTRRQYSFAAPCVNQKEFEIVVDVTPMGPGSKFFLEKKVGDIMQVLAPLGTFYFEEPTNPVVFVATGTGIVPFRTMIEEYLTNDGKQDIYLYWGLRHEEDIFWKEMLDRWQKSYCNFHYSIILSKPSDVWQGKIGHVTEHILEEITNLENHTFYLCGNKNMIIDLREKLKTAGVPDVQMKSELF